MTTDRRTATAAFTLWTIAIAAGCSAQNVAEHLSGHVGPPNPQLYKPVLDAKNWKNPYLVIRPDGIEILSNSFSSGRKTVGLADLQRTLIELPESAWPYGRVVAVQEIGTRSGRRDDKPIADNLAAAIAILKQLQVTVDGWPSA